MQKFILTLVVASTVVTFPAPRTTGGGKVLATLARDTVLLTGDSVLHVVWRGHPGHDAVVRWTSGRLYGEVPVARLLYANRDSIPDLFVTLNDEEMISGALLVGTARGSRSVYKSGPMTCAVPDLEDVDGDGMVDIVEHWAGAVAPGECRGDAAASPCLDRYHLTWERVLVQQANGAFLDDSFRIRRYYGA